ncbi:hypothetical protein OBBRIDRAFT_797716 [Obba rivulosa]|uniref:DNA polymerase delta subunit 4 n=1 Tax=Obba rivulosa TaxID=1052685 RepID=A0A8E2AV17_9APHY|nr:hypothetical protein OBBRIDRAFT_797716 [Obba rivulosa]
MAPKRSLTTTTPKLRDSSHTKQATLSFPSSKPSTDSPVEKAGSKKPSQSSTAADQSSTSPEVPETIDISDSDDDKITVETPVTQKTPAGRKTARDEPASKRRKVEGRTSARAKVFDSRESVENVDSDEEEASAKKRKRAGTRKGRGKKAKDEEEPVKTKRLVVKEEKGVPESWRKHYGVVREKMGHLQPIHAENETMVHHILRVFDLSYEYGPCIGVTRMQRWERAEALGLKPPPEVKEILETKGPDFTECVFHGEV